MNNTTNSSTVFQQAWHFRQSKSIKMFVPICLSLRLPLANETKLKKVYQGQNIFQFSKQIEFYVRCNFAPEKLLSTKKIPFFNLLSTKTDEIERFYPIYRIYSIPCGLLLEACQNSASVNYSLNLRQFFFYLTLYSRISSDT